MKTYIIQKLAGLQTVLKNYGELPSAIIIAELLEHADTWEEYSSQGPAYQAVENWWKANANKVPGDYQDTYSDWTDWYMGHYYQDWDGMHKSPEETLETMKGEVDLSYQPTEQPVAMYPYQETYKEKKNIFQKKNIHSIRSNNLGGEDLIPTEARNFGAGTGRQLNVIQDGKVNAYAGVNLDNITPELRRFIKVLGDTAAELDSEIPIITSGWRSYKKQAEIMANNWTRNGGMNGGLEYLINIYGRKYGKAMHDIFATYGTGLEALPYAIEEVQKHPGAHVAEVGRAIDLNPTRGIKVVLDTIKKSGMFNMKIVDETNTAGPHYHVQVK